MNLSNVHLSDFNNNVLNINFAGKDFNMLPWSKETIMRNIETKIGNIVNGSGTPYMIWIYGKTKVNP